MRHIEYRYITISFYLSSVSQNSIINRQVCIEGIYISLSCHLSTYVIALLPLSHYFHIIYLRQRLRETRDIVTFQRWDITYLRYRYYCRHCLRCLSDFATGFISNITTPWPQPLAFTLFLFRHYATYAFHLLSLLGLFFIVTHTPLSNINTNIMTI